MPDYLPKSEAERVIWFADHAAETTWAVVAYDTSSPYTDARAPLVAGQPESRRFPGTLPRR